MHLCTNECLRQMVDGRLVCNCSEDDVFRNVLEWKWTMFAGMNNATIEEDRRTVTFHPTYSCGTSVIMSDRPLERNRVHYWEIKILSRLYGTDVLIGVGTPNTQFILSRFYRALGSNDQTWGYSYMGEKQYNGCVETYGFRYKLGSVIGVEFDTFTGSVQFYNNGRRQGVAFSGIGLENNLHAMMSSTAAQSTVKLITSQSDRNILQYWCMQVIVNNKALRKQYEQIPQLKRLFDKKFFWLAQSEGSPGPVWKDACDVIKTEKMKKNKIVVNRLQRPRL